MIRAATLDDIPALLDMGMRFHAGSGYADLIQPNKAQVSKTLAFLIENDMGAVFVADLGDGTLAGAILGLAAPHFVSGQVFATELAWWVDPEHRGFAGPRLLERLERWARGIGATTMSLIEPPGNPAVGKFYERRGYQLAERNYMKALT